MGSCVAPRVKDFELGGGGGGLGGDVITAAVKHGHKQGLIKDNCG